MKRIVVRALPALLLAACAPELPTGVVSAPVLSRSAVTKGASGVAIISQEGDAGEGTLRHAVEMANADPLITRIEFAQGARTIRLQSPVVYTGSQSLTIVGRNATLDASHASGPAFVSTGGADLTIEALTVTHSTSEGLAVELPASAAGVVFVVLDRVHAIGNAGHGILIDDQANNSPASLDVRVSDTRFVNNGYSVSDRDGLRVNEGGEGSLTYTAVRTHAEDNAADGIELDERGAGDVIIDVEHSSFLRNGKFDPEDLDDGFDVDEEGMGTVRGALRFVTASDNFQQGLDFNENDAGDLRVDLYYITANGNVAEGIEYEEDDDTGNAGTGDIVTIMRHITALGNARDGASDAGLKIREKGAGNLMADLEHVKASRNVLGESADIDAVPSGILVREDFQGDLSVRIANARAIGNANRGIDIDENGSGSVGASLSQVVANGNGDYGIRADDQSPTNSSSLTTDRVVAQGNGSASFGGNVIPSMQ